MTYRTLRKNTRRLIKSTKGRFFSLCAITALGTAFFTGVSASSKYLAYTVDHYDDETNLKDVSIYSNYGFEDEDIQAILDCEEVASAEGSKFVDVMAAGESGAWVARVHSYDPADTINQFVLRNGRLPENDHEVLTEAGNDLKPGLPIGTVVTFSRPADDLDEWLSVEEVTVVGTIDTPVYLNMTKENSTLSNQYISTYFYIPESAFVIDYDVEINIVGTSGKKYNSFYDAYEDYDSSLKETIEEIAKTQQYVRYESIKEELMDEYNNGLDEYNEALDTFHAEIADAGETLSNAESEIEQGYADIAQAEADLTEAQATLNTTYASTKQTIDANRSKVQSEQQKLSSAQEELDTQKAQYEAQLASYNENASSFEAFNSFASTDGIDTGMSLQEIRTVVSLMDDETALASFGMPVSTLLATLDQLSPLYEALGLEETSSLASVQEAILSLQTQLSEASAQIESAQQEINAGQSAINNALSQIESAEITLDSQTAAAQSEIDAGWQDITDNRIKLEEAEEDLAQGRKELEDNRTNGQQELEDAKAALDKALQEINDLEDGEWTVVDRSQHYASATFKNTVEQMQAIADIFPVFFFFVAALVCLTTMTRMVDEQRSELGTLRALGYTRMQCTSRYLIYALSASCIGVCAGSIIGLNTFPLIIYTAWKMMYVLPDMRKYIPWDLIIICLAGFAGTMALTCLYTCRQEMHAQPSGLMRPKAPALGRSMFLEKISVLWNRLSFTWKVTIRNLVRYKKRLIMTLIGVAGCSALLICGFGIKESVNAILDVQFGVIQKYNYYITVGEDVPVTETEEIMQTIKARDDVSDVLLIGTYNGKTTADNGMDDTAYVQIYNSDEDLKKMYLLRNRTDHEEILLPSEGVIISEKLAENMGVSIGDTLRVESESGVYKEVVIRDICEMYVYHFVIMSADYYRDTFGTVKKQDTIMVTSAEGYDSFGLQNILSQDERISGITYTDDVLENFSQMIGSLDMIVWVIIVSSMMLAFVVLGNLMNINISERMREIATLKVLGFHAREVESYIYKENNVLTALGALCGIPVGTWLHRYIMGQLEMDYIMFGRTVSLQAYILSIIMTIAFGMVVDFFMRPKLAAVKMVESLKSVE